MYFGDTEQDQDIKVLLLFYLSGLEKISSLSECGNFGLKRSSWKCCRYGREEHVLGNERRVRERGRDFSSILYSILIKEMPHQ